ncbi:MAG: hypothetical protein RJA61_522 [Candidatus Parcubacteria bacterium]|jgi:regulator of sigma E protease
MSIIIFLIILSILVFVHEFGHYITAKKNGIRVDEFAIGFPPRIFSWMRGETRWSINLIPIGGYVKIFGENPDEESLAGPDSTRSFVNKPKRIQALVLSAGIIFNILFAWLLITLGFVFGFPVPAGDYPEEYVHDRSLVVIATVADSPAALAGVESGDTIASVTSGAHSLTILEPEAFSEFISEHGDKKVVLELKRGETLRSVEVIPLEGVVSGKPAIGVSIDTVGTLKLPFFKAIAQGVTTTGNIILETIVGLSMFFFDAFRGQGDFSQVSGPVGIAGLVGGVAELGFMYLISLTALISINLAVINLIPFPALDGGRLLFVAIEAVTRKPISPKVANTLNGIGFLLLLLLMVVVTYNDIAKLF